jgi:hypothetical protein
MKKSKKNGNVNIAEKNLSAFMKGMEDNDTRQLVANLQATKEYLEEELRIYRKKYTEATGKERPDLTDDERRSLARKGMELNSLLLSLVDSSWSPQTVMGWYNTLIADKYNRVGPGQKKRGRKRIAKDVELAGEIAGIEEFIVKLAEENRNWGYGRIRKWGGPISCDPDHRTSRRMPPSVPTWRRWRAGTGGLSQASS